MFAVSSVKTLSGLDLSPEKSCLAAPCRHVSCPPDFPFVKLTERVFQQLYTNGKDNYKLLINRMVSPDAQ